MTKRTQPRNAADSVPEGTERLGNSDHGARSPDPVSGPEVPTNPQLTTLLERQCRLGPAEAGVLFGWAEGVESHRVLAIVPTLPGTSGATAGRTWLQHAVELAARLRSSGPLVSRKESDAPPSGWVYVKNGAGNRGGDLYDSRGAGYLMGKRFSGRLDGTGDGVLVFAVRAAQSELETIAERLDAVWGASEAAATRQALEQVEGRLGAAAEVLDVSSTLAEQTSFRGLATALCDTLAARLSCDRVSLGLTASGRGGGGGGRSVRVRAMSHTEKLLLGGTQVTQDIELAMEECLDQDTGVWTPYAESAGFVARAATELSRRGGHGTVLSMPIRTLREADDEPMVYVPGVTEEPGRGTAALPRGVLTLEREASRPFTFGEAEMLRVLLDLESPRLWLLAARDRWIGARAAGVTRRAVAVLLGPRHTWLKLAAIAIMGVAAFLVTARGTYRVEASFRIEAVQRQVLPAAYDGYLREVFTRIGERVKAGDVLARLDDTQLRLQASESRSELAAHMKEASVARDQGKAAEEQIARAQANRVQAHIDLLELQISQSKLVAPITGVVVTGDLEKMLGAPVQTGQVLFELAPLEALRAELLVGEDQIGDVRPGQVGKLATVALPGERLAFRIERVDPIAEVQENRSVFRVRASLESPAEWMRPGMGGVARIEVDSRRYAWIWTRRLVNWARMKLWV